MVFDAGLLRQTRLGRAYIHMAINRATIASQYFRRFTGKCFKLLAKLYGQSGLACASGPHYGNH